MSLEDFLLAKGISAEKILEIEYIRAVAPRKEEDPSLHDDWVSAVEGSSRFILTGCYDGLGRIWEAAGDCTHVLEGHNDAITSVAIVKTVDNEDTGLVVATGSKDKTMKLWKYHAEPNAENLKTGAFRTLRGHTDELVGELNLLKGMCATMSQALIANNMLPAPSTPETSQLDLESDEEREPEYEDDQHDQV